MLGTFLDAGDRVAVNKTNINPCPHGNDIPGEERDSKQIIKCLGFRQKEEGERMRAAEGHRVLNNVVRGGPVKEVISEQRHGPVEMRAWGRDSRGTQ